MVQSSPTWPPALRLEQWRETHDTLHMWMQIVGKTRMAFAPAENHWWHVTMHLTARGLTTTPIPYGAGTFEIEFDFVEHRLIAQTSDGLTRSLALQPQTVADFYHKYLRMLADLGITLEIWPVPVEVERAIPFANDVVHASYDAAHAYHFFEMLTQADRVTKRFRGRFLGKSSPVHFFWGAMDLALTRFSGRRAPEPKVRQSPMMREAMSHEEISVGFWPGSSTVAEPAFYAYARPEPPSLPDAAIRPATAYYSRELADFILPYEPVRAASRPDDEVLDFYESVYAVAADRAGWDRAALDRPATEWP
jgi:hypothetical protein